MDRLGDKIITQILPAVLDLASRQDKIEKAIAQFSSGIHDDLATIGANIDEQKDVFTRCEGVGATARQEAMALLKQVENGSSECLKTCHAMHDRISQWTDNESTTHEERDRSMKDHISNQLRERETVLTELETKLQLLTEDYAAKIEGMKSALLENDEEGKKSLRDFMERINDVLVAGFREVRKEAEQRMRESEVTQVLLKSELQRALEAVVKASSDAIPQSEGLQKELYVKEKTIVSLKETIADFERESTKSEQLCARWKQDIQTIDALKDQLKAMGGRIPQIETLSTNFNQITQVGQIMNSTSSYLKSEHEWVSQELGDDASDTQDNDSLQVTLDKAAVLPSAISRLDNSRHRKVIVNPPESNTSSPEPPPSIAQERQRRREAKPPQSILRFPTSLLAETQGLVQQVVRSPLNHTKYNRPVMGEMSTTTTTHDKIMIEQIRSGLVQKKRSYQAYPFPTVADFERETQPVNTQEANEPSLGAEPPAKKPKTLYISDKVN